MTIINKLEYDQSNKKSPLKKFLEIPGIIYIFPLVYLLVFPFFYFLTYKLGGFTSYYELNLGYFICYFTILIGCYIYGLIMYEKVFDVTAVIILSIAHFILSIFSGALEVVASLMDYIISKISKEDLKKFVLSIVKSIFSDFLLKILGDLINSFITKLNK